MRIAVVGARSGRTKEEIVTILKDFAKDGDVIVSGGAMGVDAFAAEYAVANKIELREYRPNPKVYPDRNPYLARNEEIVKDSDVILAFPTNSPGTWNTIGHARSHNKRLIIFRDGIKTNGLPEPSKLANDITVALKLDVDTMRKVHGSVAEYVKAYWGDKR